MSNIEVMIPIDGLGCTTVVITSGPGTVGDVNLIDFIATIADAGAVELLLESPEGTEILLFNDLCNGTADIDLSLDDQAPGSVASTGCQPLGNGAAYKPQEAFKAFVGEEAAGDWILSLFTEGNVSGTIESFDLQVLTNNAYTQMDTLISNDPTVCEAEFTWVHPVFGDNYCEGSMEVTYDFSNDVTGEMITETLTILTSSGFIDLDGSIATRVFPVGITEVTYTLEDLAGNESTCGFTVTVIDDEAPTFPLGCGDVELYLEPGECTAQLPAANRPLVEELYI